MKPNDIFALLEGFIFLWLYLFMARLDCDLAENNQIFNNKPRYLPLAGSRYNQTVISGRSTSNSGALSYTYRVVATVHAISSLGLSRAVEVQRHVFIKTKCGRIIVSRYLAFGKIIADILCSPLSATRSSAPPCINVWSVHHIVTVLIHHT
jgi:hypothetical protein